ncbi:hypothetical protein TOK_5954 [Pseudonocardia sp. N23]|nr:hypothetical protein TOK_5954 [Pseudonocardia sp. N23]
MGGVMSYVLVPAGDDTRLLLKVVTGRAACSCPSCPSATW